MKRTLKKLPKLATLAALIVLAACSDQATSTAPLAPAASIAAPAMPSVAAQNAVVAEEVETPAISQHGTFAAAAPSNTQTYQFGHDPKKAMTYIIGWHMVTFPAYTICDAASSGYGANYWLSSCTKLTTPITITATTWTDAQGRPQIDFQNSIRFYQNNSGQLPAIYLRDPSAALSQWSRIDYCSPTGCVNEVLNDSVLATQRDSTTGYLYRLIRHFSGYNVWA